MYCWKDFVWDFCTPRAFRNTEGPVDYIDVEHTVNSDDNTPPVYNGISGR